MAMVGAFPGLENQRITMRSPTNPLDKSTVVSILPKPIREVKYTLTPSTFELSPGSYENPALLVVGPSSWWKDVGEEQPLLEIPVSSIQIADSIVNDYCNGLLGCDMSDAVPGIFFIPGSIDKDALKTKHKTMLDRALANQKRWYNVLIKLADSYWSRTNGNPLAISDDMRLAAREMGVTDKDWMEDFSRVGLERCPACGTMRNPSFPMCSTCKAVIDPEKLKKLGIKFAE